MIVGARQTGLGISVTADLWHTRPSLEFTQNATIKKKTSSERKVLERETPSWWERSMKNGQIALLACEKKDIFMRHAWEIKAELNIHKTLTFSVSVPPVLVWNGMFDYWQEEFFYVCVYTSWLSPCNSSANDINAKIYAFAIHMLKAERKHTAELTPWANSPGNRVH